MRVQLERKRAHRHDGDDGSGSEAGRAESTSVSETLREEIDDLLDDIDSLLETNAEEFVKNYVQKGGE